MLVWFGVQEALASASGGAGFNMGKFVSLFMLLTFAYAMVKFYDSSHPRRWLSHRAASSTAAHRILYRSSEPTADEHPEHIESSAINERTGDNEGAGEPHTTPSSTWLCK